MKYRFEHYRPENKRSCNGRLSTPERYKRGRTWWEPAAKGGYTACIFELDEQTFFITYAWCNSDDHFNYKIGRNMALYRMYKLLQRLGLSTEYEEEDFKSVESFLKLKSVLHNES